LIVGIITLPSPYPNSHSLLFPVALLVIPERVQNIKAECVSVKKIIDKFSTFLRAGQQEAKWQPDKVGGRRERLASPNQNCGKIHTGREESHTYRISPQRF
jgi:hypothetical protein